MNEKALELTLGQLLTLCKLIGETKGTLKICLSKFPDEESDAAIFINELILDWDLFVRTTITEQLK